ncbi:MAG TPA: polyprenol monophosphomannose synthase [Vicinamibacterales bacterium]
MRPVVIVPTYNERANIALLVPSLLEIENLHVLVVDDGSPDGTGQDADRLALSSGGRMRVLHRTGRRGYGRSHLDGMRAALETDATHVCQMDADLSHDPADLRRILEAADRADLLVGSRYVEGGRVQNWPRRRRALSTFANWYVRAVTGLEVRDLTSGFRCWSRPLLAALDLTDVRSDGYAFQVELAWKARQAGGRILEVPITFVERREGASKLSWRVIAESAVLPWRLARRAPVRATLRVP